MTKPSLSSDHHRSGGTHRRPQTRNAGQHRLPACSKKHLAQILRDVAATRHTAGIRLSGYDERNSRRKAAACESAPPLAL
jgi:hypothetical protein